MNRFNGLMLILIALFLSACAGQGVKMNLKTESPQCGTKEIDFQTDYQVEQLKIGREIEGGGTEGASSEGCGGSYTIDLGKGTTKDADPAMWNFLNDTMERMERIMLGPMAPALDEGN